jgi:hypothetical protein
VRLPKIFEEKWCCSNCDTQKNSLRKVWRLQTSLQLLINIFGCTQRVNEMTIQQSGWAYWCCTWNC